MDDFCVLLPDRIDALDATAQRHHPRVRLGRRLLVLVQENVTGVRRVLCNSMNLVVSIDR